MFKIEKNVEIPTRGRGGESGVSKYPFKEMSVGDSFLFKCSDEDRPKALNKVTAAHFRHTRINGYGEFCVRSVEGGVRVWRIK